MINIRQYSLSFAYFAVPAGALIFFFWPTVVGLSDLWLNNEKAYSHCYLLLICTIFFCTRKLTRCSLGSIQPYWPLLLPVVGFNFLLALFQATSIDILSQSILPVSLILGIGFLAGRVILFKLLPSLGLLLLCTPVLDLLLPALQYITAIVVEYVLEKSSIPVFIQGTYIALPGGTLHIADSCGGLRYLLAGISMSYVMLLHFEISNIKLWFKILGITIAVAIISNWFRVWLIVQIAYYSNMEHPLVHDHYSLGWWIFAIFLYPLLYIFIRKYGSLKPNTEKNYSIQPINFKLYGAPLLVALSIALCYFFVTTSGQVLSKNPLLTHNLENQKTLLPEEAPWVPGYSNADHIFWVRNTVNNTKIYSGFYAYESNNVNSELISYGNNTFDPLLDSIKVTNNIEIHNKTINQTIIKRELGSNFVVHHWYNVGGKILLSNTKVKLYEAYNFLFGDGVSFAVVIFAKCKSTCDREVINLNQHSTRVLKNPST